MTPPYYEDAAYIEALASSIEAHLATLSFKPELIVASFHGMPKSYVDKGDPYQGHCVATTEALRRRLGMDETKLLLTFQSRFGNDEWLQPYTDKTMERLGERGRAPDRGGDAGLLGRLPGDAGGDRAGECRDLQAQWR